MALSGPLSGSFNQVPIATKNDRRDARTSGYSMGRKLVILDPNLKNLLGHYFEYDRSVGEAALNKGLECYILAHREASLPSGLPFTVHPVYSWDIWKTVPGENYHSERNITEVSAAFAAETLKFFQAGQTLSDGDILFLPTITKVQLLGAAALAEALAPKGVRLQIMLRYQSAFYDGPTAASAFRRLEEAEKFGSISLCSDSHRLAGDLSALTSLPIQVYPIPHTDQLAEPASALPKSQRPIHFVSLGNARGEKGLIEIFKAIRKSAQEPWADQAHFTLQCNDPSADVIDAIEAFRKIIDPRVTLIDRVLDSEDYYSLLRESDAVLVPYHRDIYRDRTSGVFLEAVTAGKIVVCTADTWMSDLLDVQGGGIAVADRSPAKLCSAIGEIVTNFSGMQGRASTASAYWKKIHSPENLVAHLLGDASDSAIIRNHRKAAVFYPWGNAVVGNSGAAARLRLLIKHLEQRYEEVRVFFASSGEQPGPLTARTSAEPYYYMRIRSRLMYAILETLSRVLGGKKGQSFHLWYHLWPLIDLRFRNVCEEIVGWADDVYLEYSYFAPIVGGLCRRFNKRLVVTQHDIVSEQSKGVPFIHFATKKLEFGALRKVPRVVLCTEGERAQCAAHDIKAELIPHPIDFGTRPDLTAEEAAFIVRTLYAVPTEGRKICLFVGSDYEPNRKAAQFIRSMANRLRDDSRMNELMFVVVGGCMEPQYDENFAALGMIEQAGLSAFYDMAAIVLVPITEGSGSSIKSIEAMGRGSVVLSTGIGMRGIPVESGKQCLIEDDLSAYPERILALVSDIEGTARLRAAAKEFAALYDFRTVFAAYQLDSEGQPPHTELNSEEAAQHREGALQELLPRARLLENPEALKFIRERANASDLCQLSNEQHPYRNQENEDEEIGKSTNVEVQAHDDVPANSGSGVTKKRTLLRRILRSIGFRVPQVRWLYQQALSMTKEAEALRAEKEIFGVENEALRTEKETFRVESEALRAEKETFRVENEALSTETKGLRVENETLRTENETLRTEKEMFRIENEALSTETEGLRVENETLNGEKEVLRVENETRNVENAALGRANDELQSRYEKLTEIARERAEQFEQRIEGLQTQVGRLQGEFASGIERLEESVFARGANLPRKYAPILRKAIKHWDVDRPLDSVGYSALLERSALGHGAKCRWCGGAETILIQRDISRYGSQSFDAWHCTECDCRFTDGSLAHVDYDGIGRRHAWYQLHHCDAEHVKNILDRGPEYFWAYMAAKYLADVPWFSDRRYRKVLELALEARMQNRKLKVIEVGCGFGVVGAVIAHLGHTYHGVDVMSEEQSRVTERFKHFGARYKSVSAEWFEKIKQKGRYDLVFSSEVIEHTAKPFDFMRRLISLAKPGGEIIFTTPDLDQKRLSVWGTDLPPIHTVVLNRKAIEVGVSRIAEPLDVTISNEDGSFDWRRVRPKSALSETTLFPVQPVQLDPAEEEFAYDVANINFGLPRLDVLERPDRLSEHYQEQMLLACLENVRAGRDSMIIKLKRLGP